MRTVLGPISTAGITVRIATSVAPGPATAATWTPRTRSDPCGSLMENAADSLSPAARTEDVVLHAIYTARALSDLRAAVGASTSNPGQTTALLKPGALPGLVGHPSTVASGEVRSTGIPTELSAGMLIRELMRRFVRVTSITASRSPLRTLRVANG